MFFEDNSKEFEKWQMETREKGMREVWESSWEDMLETELWYELSFSGCEGEAHLLPWETVGEMMAEGDVTVPIDNVPGETTTMSGAIMALFDLLKRRVISYKTYKMTEHVYSKYANLPKVAQCAIDGDWQTFSEGVHTVYQTMTVAFQIFYPFMPDEYRRDFAVGCYDDHGDSNIWCREAVKALPRNGVNELPEEYRDAEEITVWRAGEEPIEEAPDFISWTLSEDMARFFLDTYFRKHASYLYRAKIKPCDVIAYDNDRNEQEVLQFRGVYDVELVDTAD